MISKQNKQLIIVIIVLAVLAPFARLVIKNQNEKSEKVDTLGVKTTGTVWKRGYGSTGGTKQYIIHFDFKKNGEYIIGHIQTTKESFYQEAIIGMKYEVKYLEKEKIKLGDSKIYINKPLPSEYKNIRTERKRIKNVYGQGKGIFKKEWRSLVEIDSIISKKK